MKERKEDRMREMKERETEKLNGKRKSKIERECVREGDMKERDWRKRD
jgi:hypothetical protein